MAAKETLDHLPRSPVREEKGRRDRPLEVAAADPEWAVGFFLDECWWGSVASPTSSSWTERGKPLRLLQRSVAEDDPEPKAISRYGLYAPQLDRTWVRFVDGRPVGGITTRSLPWCAERSSKRSVRRSCS